MSTEADRKLASQALERGLLTQEQIREAFQAQKILSEQGRTVSLRDLLISKGFLSPEGIDSLIPPPASPRVEPPKSPVPARKPLPSGGDEVLLAPCPHCQRPTPHSVPYCIHCRVSFGPVAAPAARRPPTRRVSSQTIAIICAAAGAFMGIVVVAVILLSGTSGQEARPSDESAQKERVEKIIAENLRILNEVAAPLLDKAEASVARAEGELLDAKFGECEATLESARRLSEEASSSLRRGTLALPEAGERSKEALAIAARHEERLRSLASRISDATERLSHAKDELAKRIAEQERMEVVNRELGKGREKLADGDLAGAVAHFSKAVERAPDDAGLQTTLGETLVMNMDWQEAEKRFSLALSTDPGTTGARLGLGKLRLARDAFEDALGEFRKALEASPRDGEALYLSAVALFHLGRHSEAEEMLRKSIEAGGEFVPAHLLLVQLLGIRGKDESEWTPCLSRLVELDHAGAYSPLTTRLLSASLGRGHEIGFAVDVVRWRPAASPEAEECVYEGRIIEETEKYIKFCRDPARGIESYETLFKTTVTVTAVERDLETKLARDFEEYFAELQGTNKFNPDSLCRLISWCAGKANPPSGKDSEEDTLRTFKELSLMHIRELASRHPVHPQLPGLLNSLGFEQEGGRLWLSRALMLLRHAQAELKGNPASAVEVLREAVEEDPNSVSLRYVLGVAHMYCGELNAASIQFETAKKMATDEMLVSAIDKVLSLSKDIFRKETKTVPCTRCGGKLTTQCRLCLGSGRAQFTCKTCNGYGYTIVRTGGVFVKRTCRACGGRGKWTDACPRCHGRGVSTCESCRGTGVTTQLEDVVDLPEEFTSGEGWCTTCRGSGITGRIFGEICRDCFGLGRRLTRKSQ